MCAFAASGFEARPTAWIAFLRSDSFSIGKLPSGMAAPFFASVFRWSAEKVRRVSSPGSLVIDPPRGSFAYNAATCRWAFSFETWHATTLPSASLMTANGFDAGHFDDLETCQGIRLLL